MTLKDFKDRFSGKECVVVGSGPTKFDYTELSKYTCPIFLINDTINFEQYVETGFFFTHHPEKYADKISKLTFFYPETYTRRKLDDSLWDKSELGVYDGHYVYHKEQIESPVVYYNVSTHCSHIHWENNEDVSTTGFPEWCFDKSEVVRRNALFGHTGSITTLLHFLWFSNFEHATLIGCNPQFRENHRHDFRISALTGRRGSLWDLKAIIENQKCYLKQFDLKHTYLGDYKELML